MEVIPELMNWNGIYLFQDRNKATIIRAGILEQSFGDGLKNRKYTLLLRITPTQQIMLYK